MLKDKGFSLIELILSLVILTTGAVSILSIIAQNSQHSVTPLLNQQAYAIAQGYLSEILAKPINDPDQVEQGLGGHEAGETRPYYDDVQDYHQLIESPHDALGQAILQLANYQVNVDITQDTLGSPIVTALRIDIKVHHHGDINSQVILSSYRNRF